MKQKRTGLMITSIAMTGFLIAAIPYYLEEGESLANAIVAAAIYYALVRAHLTLWGIAALTQWLGVFTAKSGFQRLASWTLLVAGILMFPSLLVIVPLLIMNRIFRIPKPIVSLNDERNQRRP